MVKKNQYYKLVEHVLKENKAKVFNFKRNKVEIYITVLTKKERISQQKYRIKRKELAKQKKLEKFRILLMRLRESKVPQHRKAFILMVRFFKWRRNFIGRRSRDQFEMVSIFGRYKKYKNLNFSDNNNFIYSFLISRLRKKYNTRLYLYGDVYRRMYKHKLIRKISENNNNTLPNVISVYVVLRRSNIFVTVVKDNNKLMKIFSPRLFRHISKKGRKRSESYFYTVKRTLLYLRRFFFLKTKKYRFKIFFKGFIKFRRPLLSRFLYNKHLKSRCLGIYNLDFEPFNGCRLKKSKRIKIRGQRKQKKNFSL
jgi:hypothetical protein